MPIPTLEAMRLKAVLERLGIVGALIAAAGLLFSGAVLARSTGDPHWMNRAGAGVVLTQLAATAVEFARSRRLAGLKAGELGERDSPDPGRATDASWLRQSLLAEEIHRARRRAFGTAVGLAALGELFHGFGDLLFELWVSSMR